MSLLDLVEGDDRARARVRRASRPRHERRVDPGLRGAAGGRGLHGLPRAWSPRRSAAAATSTTTTQSAGRRAHVVGHRAVGQLPPPGPARRRRRREPRSGGAAPPGRRAPAVLRDRAGVHRLLPRRLRRRSGGPRARRGADAEGRRCRSGSPCPATPRATNSSHLSYVLGVHCRIAEARDVVRPGDGHREAHGVPGRPVQPLLRCCRCGPRSSRWQATSTPPSRYTDELARGGRSPRLHVLDRHRRASTRPTATVRAGVEGAGDRASMALMLLPGRRRPGVASVLPRLRRRCAPRRRETQTVRWPRQRRARRSRRPRTGPLLDARADPPRGRRAPRPR